MTIERDHHGFDAPAPLGHPGRAGEKLSLELPLEVVDTPALAMHMGHGQREGSYDGLPHMRRLFLRKARKNPLGVPKFLWKSFRLECEAKKRARANQAS